MAELSILSAQEAVQTYYQGERLEMWSIIVGSILFLALCIWLFMAANDAFGTGLLGTAVLGGILLAGTAVSLLVRDAGAYNGLLSAIERPEAAGVALCEEAQRITEVIANYPVYRKLAITLFVVAAGLMALGTQAWMRGIAVGLALFAVGQSVIDHYSEVRAKAYADALSVICVEL